MSHGRRRDPPYRICMLLSALDPGQPGRHQTDWGEICCVDALQRLQGATELNAVVLSGSWFQELVSEGFP